MNCAFYGLRNYYVFFQTLMCKHNIHINKINQYKICQKFQPYG